MIPKSGCRFSEKIMLKKEAKANALARATLFSTRAMPRQHFTHGFKQFFLRYGALRSGLLLQMLFAAFFRFRKLGVRPLLVAIIARVDRVIACRGCARWSR